MPDLVVITGASQGLGLAMARNVPFPAHIIDISRSGPPESDQIDHIDADLSDPATWARTGTRLRRVIADDDPSRAVFVHAAATLDPTGFAAEIDSDAYVASVLLNSAAGQVLGQHFLAGVAGRRGRFDIVMISSGAAGSVYAGWSAYGAGKAALDQWVRNVGAEQKVRGGVTVSAIAPGVLATSMQEEIRSRSERDFPAVERFIDLYQKGRLVAPDDAARQTWETIENGIETGSVLDLRKR